MQLVIGAVFLTIPLLSALLLILRYRYGKEVEATVVGIDFDESYYAVYRYCYEGERYTQRDTYGFPSPVFEIGQTVRLRCSRSQPKSFMVNERPHIRRRVLLDTAFAGMGILLIVSYALGYRIPIQSDRVGGAGRQ